MTIRDRFMAEQRTMVLADRTGLNSRTRSTSQTSSSPTSTCANASSCGWARYQKFDDAFTFQSSRRLEHGWVWAHAYQFEPGLPRTFIVECTEETLGEVRLRRT